MTDAPDLIVTNARVSTLDRANPTATAVAITDDKFFTRPPWSARLPVRDLRSFWGALGCSCWAA
jgi:hypothetical protein